MSYQNRNDKIDLSVQKFDLKNKQKFPLANIFHKRLCTGCGACVAICSKKILSLNYSVKKGLYFAKIVPNGIEKCSGCGLCHQVCPAVNIVESEKIPLPFKNKQEILKWLIADYEEIYVGHAIHNKLRYQCSSGGLATAILLYKLKSRQIDSVLLAKPMSNSATMHEINFVDSEDEIIENSGTVYCQINYSNAWKYIEKNTKKMAILGQPCHLNAINLYSTIRKLDKSKHFKIGLFCGGTNSHLAMNYLLKRKNIDPNKISKLRYRSGGWPGRRMVAEIRRNNESGIYDNKIIFDRDSSRLQSYLYQCCFSGSFYPDICLACKNQTAESADISLGDAWLPRYISSDKLGTNIIICRTERGKMLLNRMANENKIHIEKASPEDVITSQGNCLVGKKIGAWANHLQIQKIDQQTIKIVKYFFDDYVPNKEMIIERRIYRWFAQNFPNKAFYLFICYNFIIKGVQILYRVYDACRKK